MNTMEILEELEKIKNNINTLYNNLQSLVDEIRSEEYIDDEPDESMDGDHESALASVGWGTDEDYGYFGDPYE